MTAPTSRSLHAPLDDEEQAFAECMRALGDGTPPPALDARIRTEARAALRKRPFAVWGASLAAVLALGVGVRVILAPTELAVPTSPAQDAPMETPSASAQALPVELRAVDEAERAAAQAQPVDSSANNSSRRAPSDGLTAAPELPPAKSADAERAVATDPAPSAGGKTAREVMGEPRVDAASQPAAVQADADQAVLDRSVLEPGRANPPAATPATAVPTPPAEPRAAAPGSRPSPVVTALKPVSVPASPVDASPVSPAAQAAPVPSPLPNPFPAAPKPTAADPSPTSEAASTVGADKRERNAPAAFAAPPTEDQAAKRDQEADGMPRRGVSLGASGRALEPPRKAQAGTSVPQPEQAETAGEAAAAEGADDMSLGRAAPAQRLSAEPTLAQLIQRARQAQQADDTDALRATLLRIDQLYPDAELPSDVQEWLNWERAR